MQKESDLRRENGKKNRIRLAGFPSKKYLEDLVVEELPDDARKKLKLLSSLEFIKTGQNVIPVSYTHLLHLLAGRTWDAHGGVTVPHVLPVEVTVA